MKKLLLLIVVLVATVTAGAQQRLVSDRTVPADVNVYLNHQGVKRAKGQNQLTAAANVISEQPEGEIRVYNRSGGCSYVETGDDGKKSAVGDSQEGTTATLCFAADNQTVYIKDPVCTDKNGSWIKGTISGNTITFPTKQYVYYGSGTYSNGTTWEAGWQVGICTFNAQGGLVVTNDPIVYTIDGTTIKLTSTSEYNNNWGERVLAEFWSDDLSWTGYSEWGTVLTLFDQQPVTPPANLETASYLFDATPYSTEDGSEEIVGAPVKVGIDGVSIYVQGLCVEKPELWAVGQKSSDGKTIVFEAQQYMGMSDGSEPIYLYSFTPQVGAGALVYTYDADTDTYTQGSYYMVVGENIYRTSKIYPNTTGIRTIDSSLPISTRRADNAVYDLQGRKVADNPSSFISHPSSPKGIYVKNGRAFVVK